MMNPFLENELDSSMEGEPWTTFILPGRFLKAVSGTWQPFFVGYGVGMIFSPYHGFGGTNFVDNE